MLIHCDSLCRSNRISAVVQHCIGPRGWWQSNLVETGIIQCCVYYKAIIFTVSYGCSNYTLLHATLDTPSTWMWMWPLPHACPAYVKTGCKHNRTDTHSHFYKYAITHLRFSLRGSTGGRLKWRILHFCYKQIVFHVRVTPS